MDIFVLVVIQSLLLLQIYVVLDTCALLDQYNKFDVMLDLTKTTQPKILVHLAQLVLIASLLQPQ